MIDSLFLYLPELTLTVTFLVVMLFSTTNLAHKLTVIGLLTALFLLWTQGDKYLSERVIFGGTIYLDGLAWFVKALIISSTLLLVFANHNRIAREGVDAPSEYYGLLLVATIGACIFSNAAELLTLFVGLEMLSLAIYPLCASAINIRASSEAGVKYFLLGSFASAILLMAIALFYGITGTTSLLQFSETAATAGPLVYLVMGLLLVGLLFKIGIVPFHMWVPDVYQGAPTTVTGYMAAAVKLTAFVALLRFLWQGFDGSTLMHSWASACWMLAMLSMVIGSLLAVRATSIKRLLAYSSIAHGGYILVGFLTPSADAGAAVLYYLSAYAFMTIGAFTAIGMALSKYAASNYPDDIVRLNGLAKRSPVLAAVIAFFLLSLAGLPPGFSGLFAKVNLFYAAITHGYSGLVIIALLCSAVGLYFYLKVVAAMYFYNNEQEELVGLADPDSIDMASWVVLIVSLIISLSFGLMPSYWLSEIADLFRGFVN